MTFFITGYLIDKTDWLLGTFMLETNGLLASIKKATQYWNLQQSLARIE